MSSHSNISTATTTEVSDKRDRTLKRVVVNTAVANAVVTLYDNTTEGVGATDADGISTSQTPAAGGVQNLTITGALASGGVATLGYNRKVTITSAADETARTFTVTGTDENDNTLTEEITGANAGVATATKDFKTVTAISVDANTAGAVTAGANAATDTVIATVTMPATLLQNHFTLEYDVQCRFGLTVVTSSTANITVVYE